MKRPPHIQLASAVTMVVLATASSALADDLAPPPWRLSHPSATVQEWDFSTPATTLLPDGNLWGGSNWVNPHGTPVGIVTGSTYLPAFGTRNGVWMMTLPTDGIDLVIPNDLGGMGIKSVWIQVTWLDATTQGPVVGIQSAPFSGTLTPVSTQVLSDGWTHAVYQATFGPCPSTETIKLRGFTAGAVQFVDQVVIDTICRPVPEPASLAILSAGALFFARRRKR